jgi:hypothetical protein
VSELYTYPRCHIHLYVCLLSSAYGTPDTTGSEGHF